MDRKIDLKDKIEALLFVAGRPLSIDELSKICSSDKNKVKKEVDKLRKEYSSKNSLKIIEINDNYKIVVREELIPIVERVVPTPEFNKAVMETLSIIAWKQPILQSDIIKIRSSSAYDHIRELLDMGFISRERHGRSYIIKITPKFLEYFELPSSKELKQTFKQVEEKFFKK